MYKSGLDASGGPVPLEIDVGPPNFQKELHFGGPIGQLKFQGDDVIRITSNGAKCYRHLITMLTANSRYFFLPANGAKWNNI